MSKVILIPDSFKGTLSSPEICGVMLLALKRRYPGLDVQAIPVADGGEGTVDAFLAACGGEKVPLTVKGPFMQDIPAFYGLIDMGRTAVIEMAAAAGLPLVGERLQPQLTTTYGVGQLIAHALERGCKKIIVGLGGSATNDLGAGCAAALGMQFLNSDGEEFVPTGATLSEIARIDPSQLHPRLANAELVTMCDINNPLYGPTGAAYVFATQKGAGQRMVRFLDDQLRAGANVITTQFGIDISQMPGAGAAGGMGAGMVAFLGSNLQMGIEILLDLMDFDRLLKHTDVVLTGEGKIDHTSLRGKVVIGVAQRAQKAGVPVGVLVGAIGEGADGAYERGVTQIFNINPYPLSFKEAKRLVIQNMGNCMMDEVNPWIAQFIK